MSEIGADIKMQHTLIRQGSKPGYDGKQLHELQFVDSAHNVVFVGGPGTGKTHLATSIGVQAIRAKGKRVRFFSTVELVNALELEKSQNKHG